MNIAMFTNTYSPHVGGVAHSVSGLAAGLRQMGHKVLVVAPDFPDMADNEPHVVRIRAMQRFVGSDFSIPLPITGVLGARLDTFKPDIVHSHHPFLLGDTALRVSAAWDIPVVYTFHTRYDLYDHYIVRDSDILRRLVRNLSIGYCNLCNAVIAPSESTAAYLEQNGVTVPVTVIPTGVDIARMKAGNGKSIREASRIPPDAKIIGHVGRLAQEKNLAYLARAVGKCLAENPDTHALIVGDGHMRAEMARILEKSGDGGRSHFTGILTGTRLADAYAAMDVFAFSSLSETQGLVLAEAAAAGVPVVALDAPGAREVVRDGLNGRLLEENAGEARFADALTQILTLEPVVAAKFTKAARKTALSFSTDRCHARVLALYDELRGNETAFNRKDDTLWRTAKRSIAREFDIIGNIAHAVSDAVLIP